MTTATSATRIRHDSDATFQEWVQEMTIKLAACGLVQTGDTGQINPATALRPAVNTSAGYQIWRFNDTLQATSPIFIRIEYRTGGGVTTPAIFIGIGTSTNGAGTLGGVTYAPAAVASMNTAQAGDTLRNSYWCHTEGFFGMNWKAGAANTETAWLLSRSVNPTTGAPTNEGLLQLSLGSGSFGARCIKLTGTTSIITHNQTNDAQICHWPFLTSTTSSLVGLDPQAGIAFIAVPRATPVVGVVGVRDNEFTSYNQFAFTPVGSTSHNYLTLSNVYPYMAANNYLKPAMLWE